MIIGVAVLLPGVIPDEAVAVFTAILATKLVWIGLPWSALRPAFLLSVRRQPK
jgi:hypothetical protein